MMKEIKSKGREEAFDKEDEGKKEKEIEQRIGERE